jgi:hypothetical protein
MREGRIIMNEEQKGMWEEAVVLKQATARFSQWFCTKAVK